VPTSRPSSKPTTTARASTKDATSRPQAGPTRSRGASKVAASKPTTSRSTASRPTTSKAAASTAAVSNAVASVQPQRIAQVVRANLPSTERLMYYGGLTALAAIGVLEWPVAAAVGAGVWVAARTTRRAARPGDGTAAARHTTAAANGGPGARG
jgi:predicted homoserine dehydrogenase-like protein